MLLGASILLGARLVSAQSSAVPPNQGPGAAPFPNAYYPGFADQSASAGAQSNQTSPPSYPSPWMTGAGDWSSAYQRAQAFVRRLTLAEKVNLTTGVGWEGERCVGQNGAIPRLGFRSLCLQDSPVGVRDTDYNSVFPGGGTIAASWDRNLMYLRGYDMGSEHRDKGSDIQLGPVVGPLGRSPEGGRNWEGFSPDPVLSGIAVAESVRGIQDAGVIACTKHFILNEQEHFRQVSEEASYNVTIQESLSSNIDDTTMHELYLWPFADAVRAGTASIMCSYNQINNSYACSNSYVLNHLLKNELGFQGFVVSDWGAQKSGVGTALAGLDMTMPGDTAFDSGFTYFGTNLTIAVLNGTVPEWRIDDMATRIIAAWYYVGRDNTSIPINFDSWTLDTFGYRHFVASEGYQLINEHVNVQGTHATDIRNMAARSTVLLKNTNGALPLTGMERLTAVIGEDAGPNLYGPNGCSDRGCDNGTLAMGWGSGSANFPFLVTPDMAIQNEVLAAGGLSYQSIFDNNATAQITALASQASEPNSVAIVFVNADSGEGYITVDGNQGDRNNLTLWHQGDALIEQVAAVCNNTMVVIHSTGPILATEWYQNENITAILWAGIPGEQSGNSIADILYGRVNPSGKLPFTMGSTRQEYGTDLLYQINGPIPQDNFAEGVFIDYRAFDKMNTTPIYEFGYGLSYTNFSYSNLQVQAHNVGAYTPTTGMTQAAPTLGSPGNASAYVVPTGFDRVPLYIYPYLNSTNLRASSGDPYYGQAASTYIPANATDGSAQPLLPAGGAPGGNPELYDILYTVSATITNTGNITGEEVVQLYVSLGGPNQPRIVLRQFDKLAIAPGKTATFSADLTRRDVSNWDTNSQNWVVTSYPKTVYVGASSRKLPLSAPLNGSSSSSGGVAPSASAGVGMPMNGTASAAPYPVVMSSVAVSSAPQAYSSQFSSAAVSSAVAYSSAAESASAAVSSAAASSTMLTQASQVTGVSLPGTQPAEYTTFVTVQPTAS